MLKLSKVANTGPGELPKMPYYLYSKGDLFAGDLIEEIFSVHTDYIIYKAKGDYKIIDYADETSLIYEKNLNKLAFLRAKLDACLSNKSAYKRFRNQIAIFYKQCLLGNEDVANKLYDKIINDANLFKYYTARLIYMFSCVIALAILLSSCYFLRHNSYINFSPLFLKVMIFGGLGGFISVAISIKKIDLDVDFFNWSQLVYGILRIIIAIICAIILYILIKSGFLLKEFQNQKYVFFLFAIVAGFSETFVPNILKKVESKEVSNTTETREIEMTRDNSKPNGIIKISDTKLTSETKRAGNILDDSDKYFDDDK